MACFGLAFIVLFVGLIAVVPAAVTVGILIVRRPDNQSVAPLPPESQPGGFPVIPLESSFPAEPTDP